MQRAHPPNRRLLSAAALSHAFALAPLAAGAGGVTDEGAPWVSNLEMPRGTAMGGAQAAVATGNDALVVNPAGLSQRKRYHLQIDGMWDAKFPGQGVGASIVDSTSTTVGTGVIFQRFGVGEPFARGEGWLFGLGYAYPAGGYNFGGLSKWLRFSTPQGEVRQLAQDFGILGGSAGFTWALVVQNLSTSQIPLFPTTATAAIAFGSDTDFRFAFDYKVDFNDSSNLKHRLNGGLELLLDQSVALRGGYSWSPTTGQQWISAGVGLVTDKVGISLAWRRRVAGTLDQYLQAALTLYLE